MMNKITKRLTAVVLVGMTMATFIKSASVESYADLQGNKKWIGIGLNRQQTQEDYSDWGWGEISTYASCTPLNINQYYQYDSGWADDYLGTKDANTTYTMRSSGCTVACVSMVYEFLEGQTKNPGDMNTYLKEKEQDTSDLNLYSVANIFGWTNKLVVYHERTANSAARSLITAQLDAGRPVIIGLAKFNSSNEPIKTHFVVAYYYNSPYIYIKDPGYGYTTLNACVSDGWEVYNLRAYSK